MNQTEKTGKLQIIRFKKRNLSFSLEEWTPVLFERPQGEKKVLFDKNPF